MCPARGWSPAGLVSAAAHDSQRYLVCLSQSAAVMSDPAGSYDPADLVRRWVSALSEHDVDEAADCFAESYFDQAPARRGEEVHGREEVRRNFERVFAELPDLRAEALGIAINGHQVWLEWRMYGTRRDGTTMEFAGVNVFEVIGGRFGTGRIYTELVRDAGGIEGQVGRMTRGPAGQRVRPLPGATSSRPQWRTARQAAVLVLRGHTAATAGPIAALVGTVLSAVNEGATIVAGHPGPVTWLRVATNYLIPFLVSSAGWLSACRLPATPGGRARRRDRGEGPSEG